MDLHAHAPLDGDLVRLAPIVADDVDALLTLHASSADARRWWPRWRVDEVESLLRGEDGAGGWWIVDRASDERVGFIQHYQELDAEYRHAGMDVFVVEAGQGRGLGTDAVRTLARWLVAELDHHRLVIDPAVANERAIRCYEKVGFRRVGVMRSYELGGDGTWHDNLLMDVLADELA